VIDRRSISQKRRAEICLRQKGLCVDCGEKLRPSMYDIDHRQALIHGGDNAPDNLVAICIDCHKRKTAKDVHGRAHAERIAYGGRERKGQPMPCGRKSKLKKKMNGSVVWR
jgi:5-methylcytosine-specific restriction endonuclease McrA